MEPEEATSVLAERFESNDKISFLKASGMHKCNMKQRMLDKTDEVDVSLLLAAGRAQHEP